MNMKQLVMTTLASLIFISVIGTIAPVASAATSSVELLLNARKMSFPDAKPFQDENSTVMVPIRFVGVILTVLLVLPIMLIRTNSFVRLRNN